MLTDLVKMTGLSIFEILMQTLALICFSFTLSLKIENIIELSWWKVFSPLFITDALTVYFSFIVFIRSYHSTSIKKDAYKRGVWNLITLALLSTFEVRRFIFILFKIFSSFIYF